MAQKDGEAPKSKASERDYSTFMSQIVVFWRGLPDGFRVDETTLEDAEALKASFTAKLDQIAKVNDQLKVLHAERNLMMGRMAVLSRRMRVLVLARLGENSMAARMLPSLWRDARKGHRRKYTKRGERGAKSRAKSLKAAQGNES